MHQKSILFIAMVVILNHCLALPIANKDGILARPSPINPDVPMDPKPAETITRITDPKEIAKIKREINVEDQTQRVFLPTTVAPPQTQSTEKIAHDHREKRDTKIASTSSSSSSSPSPLPTVQPLQKPELSNPITKDMTASLNDKQTTSRRKRSPSTSTSSSSSLTETTTTTQVPLSSTTVSDVLLKHRQKRAENVQESTVSTIPLIYRDQHKQPLPIESSSEQSTAQYPTSTASHLIRERDIPVPLVPKYSHPEESPKSEEKEDTITSSTEQQSSSTTSSTMGTPVAVEQKQNQQQQQTTSSMSPIEALIAQNKPIPVAELFAKGKSSVAPEEDDHKTN